MSDRITELREQISALKTELAQEIKSAEATEVQNFEFESTNGPVKLSDLFGENECLLVVHNMGAACNYCTMWADGFSGYLRHLERNCAFVVCSPDPVENQAKLAAAREWKFIMVRDASKQFSIAMGYWSEKDGWWPGVSAFQKQADGTIIRTGNDFFGPGDDYNLVWPMLDLIGGPGEFEPN